MAYRVCVVPCITLVIRNVPEHRVNSYKFMMEISNFIRSFKKFVVLRKT